MNFGVDYGSVCRAGWGRPVLTSLNICRTDDFETPDLRGVTREGERCPSGNGGRFRAVSFALMAFFHLRVPAWAEAAPIIPVETNYVVKAWMPADGLPQSTIVAMAQTPDGYLWLGTFNGLARFDGVRFVVFNPVNTPALRSARIVTLWVDRNGWLWIFTEDGFVTRVVDGRFEAMNGSWGLPPGRVSPRGLDPGGNLWLAMVEGTTDRMMWSLGDQKFTLGVFQDLEPGEVAEVVVSDRSPWFRRGGAAGKGWEKSTPSSFANGLEQNFGLRGRFVYVPASDGDAWVVSSNAVGKLRHGGFTRLPEGVSISEPTDAVEDRAGNLLIGTWTQGLLIYTPDHQLRSIPLAGGSSAQAVRVVRVDREGNPWIGTDLAGVQRLQPRTFHTYLGAETGRSGVVRSIAEDRAGRVWSATPEGLEILLNEAGSTNVVTGVGAAEGLWWAITSDREGQIWAGSTGLDFCRFADTRPEKFFQLYSVRVVSPAAEGGVWIGTDHGLWRANGNSLNEQKIPAGMTNQQVRALVEQDGILWAGLFGGGLWRKDQSGWSQFGAEKGLVDLRVTSLYAEAGGVLWFGTTFGGLHRLKDGRCQDFRRAGLRLPAMVACIVGDDLGFLWLGSMDGIYRVAKRDLDAFADGTIRDLVVEKYDSSDGLQTTEMSEARQPTALKAHDGRLWFATINGLSVVDPSSVPQNSKPPPVLIEEVSVNGIPVATGAGGEIEIPALSQRVTFQYTGISLKSGARVRFKRRLFGLGRNWEDAGAERSATYYNLPPGPYRFEVVAANENGVWSPTAVTVGLRALPAFWQAGWFRLGTGLLVVGAVAAGIWARLRALARAQAAREAFSQELIESQEQERRRISAGLHDGLGQALLIIKHQAGQAAKTPGAPPEAVEKWSRVSHSAQAAIDEVRGIVSALRPAMLESIGLSGALSAMLQQAGESGDVKLSWTVADMAGAIDGGRDIELFRVVQEALNNIHKHSKAAHARIELRREPGRWVLEIEDDGCGFDDTATRVRGGHGGFGLRGMRERLRILGGTLTVASRPGTGVRLRAEAPIHER